MISQECRDAIEEASKLLEPYVSYKFIGKALDIMKGAVLREDWDLSRKAYEERRKNREKKLLAAFEEGKIIQYCYARNRGKKHLIWDDLPKNKVLNFIEHGMWEYMKIKGETDETIF